MVKWHKGNELVQQLSKTEFGLTLKLTQSSQTTVNFLDIKITLSDNTFLTTVFVKPTTTPVIIPKWSYDPWAFKKSAFTFYFTRSFTHCSNNLLRNKEICRIFSLGCKFRYNDKFMQRISRKIESKFLLHASQLGPSSAVVHLLNPQSRVPLPFKLHSNSSIKSVLKSTNKTHTFKRGPTIYNLLRNNKSKRALECKSGVYKIPTQNNSDNKIGNLCRSNGAQLQR